MTIPVSIVIGLLFVLVIIPIGFLSTIERMTMDWESRHVKRDGTAMPWYVRLYYALKK
jgi:hypothetical protein